MLLLTVAIVGTTVAPWQLFFQQSNVVDKRITARWIPYARADLVIGIVVVMAGATALMAVTAFGLTGTADVGNFTDAGAVASALSHHVGPTMGALFAIILLDASLIGANAIGLATTYAVGDAIGRRHSLHWKISEAPLFYGGYALLLAVSAAVAFSPDHILGLVTQGVQALAGVLLPSATVFLVLLCNDRGGAGSVGKHRAAEHPRVDHRVVSGVVVIGIDGHDVLHAAVHHHHRGRAGGRRDDRHRWRRCRDRSSPAGGLAHRREAEVHRAGTFGGGLDPEEVDEIDDTPSLTRAERRAVLRQDRANWQTPSLAALDRPVMSPIRRAGLLTLRAYLVLAVVFVVIKVVEVAIA